MSHITSRHNKLVSLSEFSDTGIPDNLGQVKMVCHLESQYILRMAIRVDKGEYKIPNELSWLLNMFEMSLRHQKEIGNDHPFCYITVRHGLVQSKTDDEWHVDGFSTKIAHVPEQNYIWSSNNGTQYVPLNVVFPDNFDPLKYNVNTYLSKFINTSKIGVCEDNTVYVCDPYMLHRRPPKTSDKMRTFVRISFVPIEINDVNNTQNPALPRNYSFDGVQFRNSLEHYP